jgi:hypothetical protein
MTLEQLDQLIAYHDALQARHDDALARLNAVRDQIGAALEEYGGEVIGQLRKTDAAPLLDALSEATVEYKKCRGDIEAVAAYAQRLAHEGA